MNPQGRFQSVLGFPNQSALKLSQVSQHPQQSKYPTLFYPACTTQENGPPPFSATQSLRQSFSFFFQGLQHSWSRISMLELSGLAVVRKTGHRPMHLRHAGPRSWMDSPVTITTNYTMDNSSTVRFPFPSQDVDEDGSMNG
jgi:hypothetical protein